MAKKKQTYADRAKGIMKKYEPRLGEKFDKGDALALEAMNQELTALKDEQERNKVLKQVEGASSDQISQLSQAFQAQNNQGPDQPGIPQGGPSGLAGGQQAAPPQIAGQSRFRGGGRLPTYQGNEPHTAQLPYGTPAYPYPEYYGDKIGDYLGEFSQGNFNNPQLGVSPYDLIQGRSPLDPRQRGARGFQPQQQQQQQQGIGLPYDLNDPTFVSNQIADTFGIRRGGQGSPGRAGFGLGTEVGSPTQIPGVTVTPDRPAAIGGGGGGTAAIGTSGIGAGTGGPGYALRDPNDPFGGLAGGPRVYDDVVAQDQVQSLPSLDLANISTGESGGTELGAALGKEPGQLDVAGDVGTEGFESRVPWIGAAAQAASSILANRQIDFSGVPDIRAAKVSPNLVDYGRERQQSQRERDIANAQVRYAARGRGSQAGLTETIGAGTTASQRIAGQQFGQSLQREGNVNAQIRNQAQQFNAQQQTRASMINAQIQREQMLINQQRRDAQVGGVGQAITGYGQDLMTANQYDQMVNLLSAENPNYNISAGKDSLLRRIFQVSKGQKVNFLDTDDEV
jgi:hypothetical protein